MNRKLTNVPTVVPPVLDADETELTARERTIFEYANEDYADDFKASEAEEILLDDEDVAPCGAREQSEAAAKRRANLRRSIMFVALFGGGFVIFLGVVCWFFGVGFFAVPVPIGVNRNATNSNLVSSGSADTGDEKLKTALQMVANESNSNANAPVVSDAPNTNQNSVPEESLTTSTAGRNDVGTTGNMIVLPNESAGRNNSAVSQNRASAETISTPTPPSTAVNNSTANAKSSPANVRPPDEKFGTAPFSERERGDGDALAKSVFFGAQLSDNNGLSSNLTTTNDEQTAVRVVNTQTQANAPPFGTILPVRLLGAVYTLREASGALVRMELTRQTSGRGFSYPTGTVLVGRLRGNEYNRAFVSVVGVIARENNALVKFAGEVTGVDGASGFIGERKSVKNWGARFLRALRETGGQAVNVLTTTRPNRGGTIIVEGIGGIGGETAAMIRGDKTEDNSFVVVRAGTQAYVMVTDLPDDANLGGNLQNNPTNEVVSFDPSNRESPKIGISSAEMAEILTTDDPQRLRAALIKMSPEFRRLAVSSMRESKQ